MTVKAIYCANDFDISGGNFRAAVVGQVVGGSHFDGEFTIDPQSVNLNSELNAIVQAYLTASPFNLTFGSGDCIRAFPAVL